MEKKQAVKISLSELKAIIEEELGAFLTEAKAKKVAKGKREKLQGKSLVKIEDKEEGKLANVAKHNKEEGTGMEKAKGAKGLAAEKGTPGKAGTQGKGNTSPNKPSTPKSPKAR